VVLLSFSGTLDAKLSIDGIGVKLNSVIDPIPHSVGADTITVADQHLLFSGNYARAGFDLVLTKDERKLVLEGYFSGEKRATLASPDGASLSGDIVNALTGHTQYAQASGNADPVKVIGHVTKLTGNATVIRNGVSIVLNVGDNVHKGDVVQAGSQSSLGITFIDGTVFGLSSNARMVLNEMIYDPNGSSNSSFLSLIQGTLTFVAGATAKQGDMKIETPVAVMGIRGTAVLVEIGFEVSVSPTQTPTPVKFQVLQEPDGTVGSYVLYARNDLTFSNPIATINRAGEVISYSANGNLSFAQVTQLAPEAKAIVDQTLQTYFPNYTPSPNANPQKINPPSSAPANPVVPDQEKLVPNPIGTPTTAPINYISPAVPDQPDDAPVIKQVEVTFTAFNTPPVISVTPVVDRATFKIADQVTITDPDSTTPPFNDVAVPYVAGSGVVRSAVGPAYTPSNVDLATLISVDAPTGAVSYDVAGLAFLKAGDKVVVTIEFDSRSGPDTVHETLDSTFVGVNDAPSITSASIAVPQGGTVVLSAANIAVSDPDNTNFTFTVTAVSHGKFQGTSDGVNWFDITAFTTADLNNGHVQFVHDGSESTAAFSIRADDGEVLNHQSDAVAGIVDFQNINDAPTITNATLTVSEGGTVLLSPADIGILDPDSASFTFTVSNVSGGEFQATADGVSWVQVTSFTIHHQRYYCQALLGFSARYLDYFIFL